MPSLSSDPPGSGTWTREQMRTANEGMVARLLGAPPHPFVEGDYVLRVLETRGRRSGRPRRTPLGVVTVGGRRYLVSPDPERDWVANLLATPACRLLAGNGAEPYRARRVDGDEAAAAVSCYLRAIRVPTLLEAFPVRPEASLEEIRAHGEGLAVLRLDPAGGESDSEPAPDGAR